MGKGKGEGFTVNVPLSTGGSDSEYGNIFEKILKPIALEYQPQLILVSAGFDTHYDDPLGGMEVTEKGFARMTQILMEIAESTAQGKLVITLEGGYDVSGQSRSVKAVLKELAQASPLDKKDLLGKREGKLSSNRKIHPSIERDTETILEEPLSTVQPLQEWLNFKLQIAKAFKIHLHSLCIFHFATYHFQ